MTKPNNNNNNDTAGADRLKNTRWEAFCVHYTGKHRRNGAAAYRAAGYKPKTPEVATVCAIALLAKPNIQARIKHLNDEALKIEQLHARDAVSRLAVIATAKITDFLDERGRVDMAKVVSSPLSAAIQEVTWQKHKGKEEVRIKLKDDMKALELLGLTLKEPEATGQNNVFIIEA